MVCTHYVQSSPQTSVQMNMVLACLVIVMRNNAHSLSLPFASCILHPDCLHHTACMAISVNNYALIFSAEYSVTHSLIFWVRSRFTVHVCKVRHDFHAFIKLTSSPQDSVSGPGYKATVGKFGSTFGPLCAVRCDEFKWQAPPSSSFK